MNTFLATSSPSTFDGFFTMLATEHFIMTIVISVLLMVCCGYFIHKHSEDKSRWPSVVAYLVMLVLMSMLFTLVDTREEYNEKLSLTTETDV